MISECLRDYLLNFFRFLILIESLCCVATFSHSSFSSALTFSSSSSSSLIFMIYSSSLPLLSCLFPLPSISFITFSFFSLLILSFTFFFLLFSNYHIFHFLPSVILSSLLHSFWPSLLSFNFSPFLHTNINTFNLISIFLLASFSLFSSASSSCTSSVDFYDGTAYK